MSNTDTSANSQAVLETPAIPVDTDAHAAPSGAAPPRWMAASVIAAAALEACGGGGDDAASSGATGDPVAPGLRSLGALSNAGLAAVAKARVAGGAAGPLGKARTYAMPANDGDAARLLLHAQFDAPPADIALVRSLGYAGFLAQRMEEVPANNAWTWMNDRGYGVYTPLRLYLETYPLDVSVYWQLFNCKDTVRKRVALALSEIFVVSAAVPGFWPGFVMANWWDMLSTQAFGNFRTLLEKVSMHPAMGKYLNTITSQKEDATGRQPDENFAREVMQLMTIGLVKLNPDGTQAMSGGAPVETFTQSDVTNLARVFTGYTANYTGNKVTWSEGIPVSSTLFSRLPMVLNPALHSTLAKTFLGTTIPANTPGAAALSTALDTLANHPNVGPFIGRQLIQRLVTSNPSPAYVGRITSVFNNNGQGVRGDLGAVVAAVLLDEEARSPAGLTDPKFGHLREPMLRFVQWGRTFGLTSASGGWKIFSTQGTLGQSPLRAFSVFNFFRPDYVTPGTAVAGAGMVSPEFQLVNEPMVARFVNRMQDVVRSGMYVNGPERPELVMVTTPTSGFDLTATYARELLLVTDADALVAHLNLVMAANQLSAFTVNLIVSALKASPINAGSHPQAKLSRICAAVLLIMACPEYLVQK